MRGAFDGSDWTMLAGLATVAVALYLSWGLPAALAWIGLWLMTAGALSARK